MERYSEPTYSIPKTLPQMLNPLMRLNYIMGTFPYTISYNQASSNPTVHLSSKTIHYYRAVFTLVLLLLSIIALSFRLFETILQFNQPQFVTIAVELFCAVHANFTTVMILTLVFLKRSIIEKYFTEVLEYARDLRAYTDTHAVYNTVRKLYLIYATLGLSSAVAVAIRYGLSPANSPVSIWFQLTRLDRYFQNIPEVVSILSAMLVFFLAVVKFSLLGNLELVSCAQATCIVRTMENLMDYLEYQMVLWKRQSLDISTILILEAPSPQRQSSKSIPKNDFTSYIEQIRELNPGLIGPGSIPVSESPSPESSAGSKPRSSLSNLQTTPGKALGHAARKFLKLASMQSLANSVFGTSLAVNIGCIVIMNVILKYLVITNFIHHLAVSQVDNGTIFFDDPTSDNMTLEQPWNLTTTNLTQVLKSSSEWLMFLGLDTSMFIRLGVIVISLGKVHKTALQFNQVMGRAFLAANQIVDEAATQLAASPEAYPNAEHVAKLLMTPTQSSSIIAFMNLNNANPVAFSAGGLFVFSRGLLLMILSIIVSYLVFLLQAS